MLPLNLVFGVTDHGKVCLGRTYICLRHKYQKEFIFSTDNYIHPSDAEYPGGGGLFLDLFFTVSDLKLRRQESFTSLLTNDCIEYCIFSMVTQFFVIKLRSPATFNTCFIVWEYLVMLLFKLSFLSAIGKPLTTSQTRK